jgi:hypothetical protein
MITFENRTSAHRRAVVASLRVDDAVEIGRHQDNRPITTGVVAEVTRTRYVKVRVGASTITFYPTGLERGGSSGGRGMRVILGRIA